MIQLVILIIVFVGMEFTAWFMHKYLMHGLMWYFHRDHHQGKKGFFEKNDFFFLIFAIPSMLLMIAGSVLNFPILNWLGTGIAIYGGAYFLVHDVYIHRRFKLLGPSNHWYFRAIKKAHQTHHSHLDKDESECFGMLFVPLKYFREAINEK